MTVKELLQSFKTDKNLDEFNRVETVVKKFFPTTNIIKTTELGFSEDDISILSGYTAKIFYKVVNQSLNERTMNDSLSDLRFKNIAYFMLKAASKLSPTPSVVFRGVPDMVTKESQQYFAGNVIIWVGFSSCSRNNRKATDFLQTNPGVYNNVLKTNKIIIDISRYFV